MRRFEIDFNCFSNFLIGFLDLFCFGPQCFMWPPATNYVLFCSVLLCKNNARAPGGHKTYILTRWGNKIDPNFFCKWLFQFFHFPICLVFGLVNKNSLNCFGTCLAVFCFVLKIFVTTIWRHNHFRSAWLFFWITRDLPNNSKSVPHSEIDFSEPLIQRDKVKWLLVSLIEGYLRAANWSCNKFYRFLTKL